MLALDATTPSLTIRRLRTPVSDGDCLASRRRWERAFAATDPVPADLADEGILLLRHVAWRAGPQRLRNLRSFLMAAQQRAVRPAEDASPANPEAIWFRDESELLFCLTRDWVAGDSTNRWWWTALGLTAAWESVVRRWLASPRFVPAAMERLACEGMAETFLAALEPRAVAALACAVADAFALPALRAGVTAHAEETSAATMAMPTRLLDLVVQPAPKVPPSAQALWLTSLLLVRRSALARSPFVERAMRDWLTPATSERLSRDGEECDVASSPGRKANAERSAGKAGPEETQTLQTCTSKSAPLGTEPTIKKQPQRQAAAEDGSPTLSTVLLAKPGIVAQGSSALMRPTQRDEPTRVSPEAGASVQPASEHTLSSEAGAPALGVRTAFGGVFYLLNVALDRGTYSDFTQPRGANLALSPFDWLALLATHWFGNEFEADPLAAMLAKLAGRQPTEKAACPENIPKAEDWLRQEAQLVHERLVAGLPELFARGLPDCVCRRAAAVRVRSQTVDVHFSLAEHPLELRLAGLDRDPGWVPAAGRAIAFHYD